MHIYSTIKDKSIRHWHNLAPGLVGTYFVVFLWAENPNEGIYLFDVLPVTLVLWLTTLVAWPLTGFLLRDFGSAPLILTIGTVVFYSFGRLYFFLLESGFVESQRPLIAGIALILVPAVGLIRWRRIRAAKVLRVVCMVLVVLVAFNIVRIINDAPGEPTFYPDEALIQQAVNADVNDHPSPDVYYFMFDMYARRITLSEHLGIDISVFIQSMQELGFQELAHSRSTYNRTAFSIPSTVNLVQLQDAGPNEAFMHQDYRRHILTFGEDVLSDTNLGKIFEGLGYRTRLVNAMDVETRSSNPLGWLLNPFADDFIETTFLRVIRNRTGQWWKFEYGPHNYSRNMTASNITSQGERPTLTYVYSFPPHTPFVFNPSGEIRSGRIATSDVDHDLDLYRQGYGDSIEYVNGVILEIVKEIINGSEIPPIIIIQSDHGPNAHVPTADGDSPTAEQLNYRTGILNLMFLPKTCDSAPPANLTSVNTFRFVLKSCFRSEIELLPNVTYWGSNPDKLQGPFANPLATE